MTNSIVPKFAQVVLGLPVDKAFDYIVPEPLQRSIQIGQRVLVLFNRRLTVAYVTALSSQSAFEKLNTVIKILDEVPVLNADMLRLAERISRYFGCSFGEAADTIVPPVLRKKTLLEGLKACEAKPKGAAAAHTLVFNASPEDQWSVIQERITDVLAREQSVIFLVPEKDSIRPALQKLEAAFKVSIVVLDKNISTKTELSKWKQIKESRASIVIGTRSAVFAPFGNLGLIIVYDEENESYKQEQAPHYHVRQAALMRADIERCSVVFMSSSPSIEIWKLAKRKDFKILNFKQSSRLHIQLIDMANYKYRGATSISSPLLNLIEDTFKKNGTTVLFIANYQREEGELPLEKRLASTVGKLFPFAKLAHYDVHSRQWPGKADIIIATRALQRQRASVRVSTMGVLNMDSDLQRFDYRASEKVFAMLAQMSRIVQDTMIIQTELMDHPVLKNIKRLGTEDFYDEELKQRKELNLPPYAHFIAVDMRHADESTARSQGQALYECFLNKASQTEMEVFDTNSTQLRQLRGKFYYTIMLKVGDLEKGLAFAKSQLGEFKKKRGTIVTLNVDP